MNETTTEPTQNAGVDVFPTITEDAAEGFIRGISAVMSAAECRQAEEENPQPEITGIDDPVKSMIIGMLTECTGVDILDSGGKDNRGWQRNRHIPMDEWDARDACSIEVWGDEVIISYGVYHYLVNFLSITDESERLNAILQEIVENGDNKSYPADVEDFLTAIDADKEGYACGGCNTYNFDNLLSQVLQYDIFEVDEVTFIALQTHNGADIRGGYSKPVIFELPEPDYFIMAAQDINAQCDCSQFTSDDAGANWYKDGSAPSPDRNWKYNRDDNTVTCRDCGGVVRFNVTESV